MGLFTVVMGKLTQGDGWRDSADGVHLACESESVPSSLPCSLALALSIPMSASVCLCPRACPLSIGAPSVLCCILNVPLSLLCLCPPLSTLPLALIRFACIVHMFYSLSLMCACRVIRLLTKPYYCHHPPYPCLHYFFSGYLAVAGRQALGHVRFKHVACVHIRAIM